MNSGSCIARIAWRSLASCVAIVATLWIVPARASSDLCFDRPGEMGRLNVLPVTIRVGTRISPEAYGTYTIGGEETVCVEPHAGFEDDTAYVSLRFPQPYSGAAPPFWTTALVSISVKERRTTVTLCVRRNWASNSSDWYKTEWHRLWVMSPPESQRHCAVY